MIVEVLLGQELVEHGCPTLKIFFATIVFVLFPDGPSIIVEVGLSIPGQDTQVCI